MKQRMIQRAFPKADSLPEGRPLAVQASFRVHVVALGVVALGFVPIACLSDATLPDDCTVHHPCGGGGSASSAGGEAGATLEHGGSGGEGNVGVVDSGASGEAGAAGDAGASGSAGAPNGGNGGSGGNGGNGGSAGTGGRAICEPCQFSPPVVPAPCGANPYSTTLKISRGMPPYMDWQITPPVDGWHIAFDPAKTDGSQAVLSGEHPEATQLTINVTDASGKLATKTYSIAPRTSCWFAYTALETDGPELHVLDPILELPPPTALAHNQGVYDFAFSPNGKYLAYRFGADAGNPKGKHLALVDLSTWNDQLLTFAEDAVTAFAWSPDSSVLAVAFSSAGSSFLSGVRPSASATPAELSLTPAAVDSDLYWVGTNRVAFYAFGISDPTNPGQLIPVTDEVTAFYAELADGGFRPVILSTDLFYGPPIVVQPADDGFFMVSATSAPYIGFNWLNADGPTSNVYGDDFVAPSGHFMAELSSGKLKLIRAKDKTQIAASGSDQTCPKFLSWAKGQERMACVADVPPDSQGKSHSEIRIFDLDSVNNLTMSIVQDYCIKTASSLSAASACTTHEYDYTEASADLQPKLFSASGNYLAFTTGSANPASNYLYWADLRSTPFTLKWKDNFSTDGTSVSPTQLAFSPDEHYLLRQLGNALSVHTLDESVNSGPRLLPFFTPDPAQAGTTCSEDFASAPDRWCGSATRIAPFVWSPDSKFAAYRSADATTTKATLTVVDFAPFPDLASHTVFAADCAQRCSGQFVFQPQP